MLAGIFLALTCSSSDPTSACPAPLPESSQGLELSKVRGQAPFSLVYPCDLPAGESLSRTTLSGVTGRQQVEMVFAGPFEIALRQSNYPPDVNPDPTGTARMELDLFPNVEAMLIQRNDGSARALYHLFWEREGRFYELQAFGPPQQRRTILEIAQSLQ